MSVRTRILATGAATVFATLAVLIPASSPAVADEPTAATTYGWGSPGWADEFSGSSLNADWGVYNSAGNGGNGLRRPSQVSVANGVMTQTGTAGALTAGMALNGHSQAYGRWETRLRTTASGSGHAYHAVTAVIPGDGAAYHCGATDVDYAEYDIGQPVYIFAHNLPNRQDYTNTSLDSTQWHTYAVEITPDHLSWFVDGQVVMTDDTSAIVSGVALAPNFQLDANYPSGLQPSTLQIDWTRYYPLRGNTSALTAPAPEYGTYNGAC